MKITKKQVRQLNLLIEHKEYQSIQPLLRLWFPQAFKEEKPKLEVGKWYNWDAKEDGVYILICITKAKNNEITAYGFRDGEYLHDRVWYMGPKNFLDAINNLKLATSTEVFDALKGEAIKRGFKDGAYVDATIFGNLWYVNFVGGEFNLRDNQFCMGCYLIFNEGQWAEVVETITKDEAEKQLGKKIV